MWKLMINDQIIPRVAKAYKYIFYKSEDCKSEHFS